MKHSLLSALFAIAMAGTGLAADRAYPDFTVRGGFEPDLGHDWSGPYLSDGGGGAYIHRANAPTLDLLRVGANYRF